MRLLITALLTAGAAFLLLLGLVAGLSILWTQPWFQNVVFRQAAAVGMNDPRPPDPPAAPYNGPTLSALAVRDAKEIFQPAQVWEAHLIFTGDEFEALGPVRIPPVQNWIRPDGTPKLRNPLASRAGIAGVLGFELPWSSGDFEFSGLSFTNAAIRYKGNGTFLAGLRSQRRPFKLDLNKHVSGQRLAGRDEINLHNLEADSSFLSDTLGYEFFREAGIPAPATTFARVFLTVKGRWERELLGLYLMVEDPDEDWLEASFQRADLALFKPVTHHFLEDLGEVWADYEEVYDPKTKVSDHQKQRLIELCRLVSHADDAEFARRAGEFVDLDQFARYMACLVLTSSYDSILDNGQNFLMWHNPATDRFGFSPWDLDHSWGEFPFVGTSEERVRASLFRPWVGEKRFLERIYPVEEFQKAYRAHLEDLLDTLFVPERLFARIDELAEVIRPAIAEQSSERLGRFEQAIADVKDPEAASEADGESVRARRDRSVHSLKHFIHARTREARAQLNGESEGVQLRRRR